MARDPDKEGITGAPPVERRKRRKLPMIERLPYMQVKLTSEISQELHLMFMMYVIFLTKTEL